MKSCCFCQSITEKGYAVGCEIVWMHVNGEC